MSEQRLGDAPVIAADLYQPPTAALADSVPLSDGGEKRLYVLDHFTMAAFLGTPLAAFWLMGANFRVMNEPARQRRAIITGILVTLLAVPLAAAMPFHLMFFGWIMIAIAVRSHGSNYQKQAIEARLNDGAIPHSYWRVLAISCATLGATALALLMLMLGIGIIAAMVLSTPY